MQLSCGDHSFPVLPHEQTVELVKMLGFDAFDLAVMGNRSHVRPEDIRDDIPGWAGRLEERIRGRGLEIADVFCIPWTDFAIMAPNNPDAAERERGTALFRDMLELTVRMGAPGLTMVPGLDFPHESHGESLARAAEELARRADEARAAGVRFSIEPHVGSVCGTPEDVARLVELAPGLELTLDYTHYVYAGLRRCRRRAARRPRPPLPRARRRARPRAVRAQGQHHRLRPRRGRPARRRLRRRTRGRVRRGSTGSAATSATTCPRRSSCAIACSTPSPGARGRTPSRLPEPARTSSSDIGSDPMHQAFGLIASAAVGGRRRLPTTVDGGMQRGQDGEGLSRKLVHGVRVRPKLATLEQVAKVLSAFELRRHRARRVLRPRDRRALPGQGEPQEAEEVARRRPRPRDRGHRARALRRPLPPAVGDRLAGGLRRVPRVLRELPAARGGHGDPRHARRSRRAPARSPTTPTTTRSGIASSRRSSTTPRRARRSAARCSGSSSRCSRSTSRRRR